MPCYKSGGCGVYEGLSCNDCPASKPEYIFRDESPCRECDHGWGSMTSTSIQSCHDTCQELKQWNERRIKFMNYDSNKQPRICEIIGVNVGEIFRIKGYNGEYHINSDGILKWGGQTSDDAIYDIINHPEHIIRRPKLTDKEIEALKAIKLIIPKAEYVEKIGSSDIVGVGNKQDGAHGYRQQPVPVPGAWYIYQHWLCASIVKYASYIRIYFSYIVLWDRIPSNHSRSKNRSTQ